MVLEGEPGWGQTREIARTGFDLEDTLTLPALKMVMVMRMRQLKTRAFTRQVNGSQRALFDQAAQVSIDRREA